ncbi:type IV secretion system protein (plasmid) [Brevundimonas staleyi]|uniref:Type IV secretion system protein n=1 Tax=Brevundimonas staleyi TaxID=74326 RepID=A0ABW0FML2_9CAUL
MEFEIFEPAYGYVDARLTEFLNERLGSVLDQVRGPFAVALVLYIVLYGYAIIRGSITEPMIDFAIRGVKLVIIWTIATTAAYSTYVTEPLFNVLPDVLARAVSGADTPNVGASFDEFFSYAAELADKVNKEASPVNIGPVVVAGVVVVVGALAAALGFGVVMVAKVALALLITLGPIFIACALFDATRRFFFGWLAQGVNYLVLFALIITIAQLILGLVRDQWGRIDGGDPVAGGLLFIALCLLGAIFFLQTPAIAAGIAGGASAGLADFGNAAGLSPYRMASSAAAGKAASGSGGGSGGGRGSIRPAGGRA